MSLASFKDGKFVRGSFGAAAKPESEEKSEQTGGDKVQKGTKTDAKTKSNDK